MIKTHHINLFENGKKINSLKLNVLQDSCDKMTPPCHLPFDNLL